MHENNLVILYQPFPVFNSSNYFNMLEEITEQESREIFSVLMNDNFVALRNTRKYKVAVLISESDKEYLPNVYSTIDTEIYYYNEGRTKEDSINSILNQWTGFKNIVVVNANTYDLELNLIDCVFNSMNSENERIAIGHSGNHKTTFLGLNEPKLEKGSFFTDVGFSYDLLLKSLSAYKSEIHSITGGFLLNDIVSLRDMYKAYKKSHSKHFSPQLVLTLSSLNNKYPNMF